MTTAPAPATDTTERRTDALLAVRKLVSRSAARTIGLEADLPHAMAA